MLIGMICSSLQLANRLVLSIRLLLRVAIPRSQLDVCLRLAWSGVAILGRLLLAVHK